MEDAYKISIRNERYKQVYLLNAFIFLVTTLALVWVCYNAGNVYGYAFAAVLLFATYREYKQFRQFEKISPSKKDYAALFIFLAAGIVWMLLHMISAGIVLICLGLLLSLLRQKFIFTFNKEGISGNDFFVNQKAWSNLNNVILKDGLLTLDFKNNKIYQAEIITEESNVTDETAFNIFCKKHIENTVAQ